MRYPPLVRPTRLLLASLWLYACTPTSIGVAPPAPDSGEDTPDVVPGDDTGETAPPDTGDSGGDTDDTGEVDPPDLPLYTPTAGTFVDPIEVTLTLENGEQAWFTLDGTLPTDLATAYTAPIAIHASVELRVLVRDAKGVETLHAKSYIRLDGGVAGFTSNLPLLIVSASGRLDSAQQDYIDISFQVHDVAKDGRTPLLGDAVLSARAALKVRGSSTGSDPKHSYALELRETYDEDDDDEAMLGMPAESDWVLYAPLAYDRALIRDALMYRLSNDLGRYAPRTRFVELYAAERGDPVTDADYQGVYVLMERIKIAPERVAITPMTPADIAEPEVTGGYLFKRDRAGDGESGFRAGTADGAFSFDDPLVYVDPDEDAIVGEQARYLSTVINGFAYALVAPDHTYAGVHYRDRIDVDAWIDNHILNLYPKNPDALRLSSHMYKDRDGRIVAGPIWDFDRAMGCTDDDRADNPRWWDATNQTSDTTAMFTYGWYAALFDDPEFNALYWPRLRVILDDTFSDDHVNGVIDEMAAELTEAAPRNYAKWSGYPPTTGSFEGEIQALKRWMQARHAWVESCLDTWPDDPERCPGN